MWRPDGAKAGDDLPVLMWIYGGKFVVGASSAPGFDGERKSQPWWHRSRASKWRNIDIVGRSVELGKPIIFVSMSVPVGLANSFTHSRPASLSANTAITV